VYAAWQLATGNPDVIVAVVDQGVKYDHEDLAANMWINYAELNGAEGVDDDGNGYVDDIYGYNFTTNTGELNFSQELMHGTHVAGTIAAVNNNGIGVCGIAGGSGQGDGVKIMSCEILGKTESGSSGAGLSGQIRAIKYAADNGAVICQNSWGYTAGTISDTDWSKGSYSALTRAIQYFNQYAGLDQNGNQEGPMAGGIVIFAAGNDASNKTCYPAADPNVVSVSATGYRGNPAYYTNYGKWVSLAAPGGDQSLSNAFGGVYSTSVAADGGSAYEGIQGTSMACPHVSGACALAVSYYYGSGKNKGLTGEMLRQALLSSTQPIDKFCTGDYAYYKGMVGVGSLDTYKLLLNIAKIDGIPAQRVSAGQTVNLDLSNYFASTNVLTYTISDTAVVSVSLSGGIMQIKGLAKGKATIIVSDGAAIRKPVEVTVQ
jgi:subtilisin-like serine proteases